jgi:hypothetical protein
MPEFPVSHVFARGAALARAAESLLRTMGGEEVTFRAPVPQEADNPTQQELGLQAPLTEDVAVSPVIMRALANGFELLVSPKSLQSVLLLRAQTAEQFFNVTASVEAQGRTFHIQSYSTETFAGRVYLYRISVVE